MKHPMFAARIKQPMFERRHYKAIANTLRCSPVTGGPFDRLVECFVVTFAKDNPRFDQHRFRDACHEVGYLEEAAE